ncbi:MAG: sigma-70 family RNA polymerase sigma factor [Lewinellaceae bacterium]|nr:sigma-70 family RNA polymerase sigma factor [Lewinellaceae bacterium]
MNTIKSSEILEKLRLRKFEVLEQIDDHYRSVFMRWAAKRFSATPNDLEDAWQEALVIFYEKVTNGELTELHCAAQTWLFATAGNYLRNMNRKMRRVIWHDEVDKVLAGKNNTVEFSDPEPEGKRKLLLSAMEKISEKCRELLRARYFDGFSIPEMMQNFQMGSENSTSAQLSKCMAGLREHIQKLQKDHGA